MNWTSVHLFLDAGVKIDWKQSCWFDGSIVSLLYAYLAAFSSEQVVVDGSLSTAVLKNLMSLTEYQIAVFAIYSNAASEGLRGTETTRKYPYCVRYGFDCI